MYLFDIGNTNIKSFHTGEIKRLDIEGFVFPESTFYYINVNPMMEQKLTKLSQAIDLQNFFDLQTEYQGIGIDRIAACYSIKNGIVVDAGSAITVDVMEDEKHLGGFILPGMRAYKESFANISSKLTLSMNTMIDLNKMPLNTNDALYYAMLKSIILMIEDTAKEKKIYMTGGDGKVLCKYLKNCIYQEDLVFQGMKTVIKEKLC